MVIFVVLVFLKRYSNHKLLCQMCDSAVTARCRWGKIQMRKERERGGENEEMRRGQGRGACQPPASSNYQCEWSVVARAMGLIRALLKETRPCPPVPLGRRLELNPTLPSASNFPSTQTHSSQQGKTLQTLQFLHNWGALTQWRKTQQFCIKKCLPHFHSSMSQYLLPSHTQVQEVVIPRSLLREHAAMKHTVCLGIFMRKHFHYMNRSCVHACKLPTASCFILYQQLM